MEYYQVIFCFQPVKNTLIYVLLTDFFIIK